MSRKFNRSEPEIIVDLLKREVDALEKALYKAERELNDDPLKELLDLRMEASKILQDKKLTSEARHRKIKPLAARERIATLKVKNGWCILKKSDAILDIKMDLHSIKSILGSWEFRLSLQRGRENPSKKHADIILQQEEALVELRRLNEK